jgi:hypothetical protein
MSSGAASSGESAVRCWPSGRGQIRFVRPRSGRRSPMLPRPVSTATETLFRGLSALRGKRVFHPHGVRFAPCSLRTAAPTLALACSTGSSNRAIVRLSRSAGLPEPLPDALGLSIRVPERCPPSMTARPKPERTASKGRGVARTRARARNTTGGWTHVAMLELGERLPRPRGRSTQIRPREHRRRPDPRGLPQRTARSRVSRKPAGRRALAGD